MRRASVQWAPNLQRWEAAIRIEAAKPGDTKWCAQLMLGSEPWITLQTDIGNREATLERPGTELFIGRDGDERKGFVLLAEFGMAGAPYIASFGVAEGSRGQGIGAELLRFVEERFASHRHLFLLVSSFNERAQKFYKHHGFEQVGEIKDYIVSGKSELIYHKWLR